MWYARTIKAARLARAILFSRRHGIGGDSAPIYLDIGARGGLPPAWRIAASLGAIRPVFVEADLSEAERLSEKYPKATVIPRAVGADNSHATLYLTRNRGRSSLLMPDYGVLSAFDAEAWTVELRAKMEVVRLDRIWTQYSERPPTYVKVDVQGYEKKVLTGLGTLMSDVLCIEFESTFIPFYIGQPTFQEMFECLYSQGFDLVKIKPHGLFNAAILEFNAFMVRRDCHAMPVVQFWKQVNDVGTHRRMVTFGF